MSNVLGSSKEQKPMPIQDERDTRGFGENVKDKWEPGGNGREGVQTAGEV